MIGVRYLDAATSGSRPRLGLLMNAYDVVEYSLSLKLITWGIQHHSLGAMCIVNNFSPRSSQHKTILRGGSPSRSSTWLDWAPEEDLMTSNPIRSKAFPRLILTTTSTEHAISVKRGPLSAVSVSSRVLSLICLICDQKVNWRQWLDLVVNDPPKGETTIKIVR